VHVMRVIGDLMAVKSGPSCGFKGSPFLAAVQ
jgi:hypothetical protein